MKNETRIPRLQWQEPPSTHFPKLYTWALSASFPLLTHLLSLLTSIPSCSHPLTNLYLITISQIHEEYPQLFRIKISLFGLAHKIEPLPPCSLHSSASGLQSSYTWPREIPRVSSSQHHNPSGMPPSIPFFTELTPTYLEAQVRGPIMIILETLPFCSYSAQLRTYHKLETILLPLIYCLWVWPCLIWNLHGKTGKGIWWTLHWYLYNEQIH